MLDPEVVRRLRAWAANPPVMEYGVCFPPLRSVIAPAQVDVAALLADWERRGEALREIAGEHKGNLRNAAKIARAALSPEPGR